MKGRRDHERGFVTMEFVAGIGLLVLPVAMMVMTFPTWSERQSIATTASREASRSYVLSGNQATAQAIVDQIRNNHHLTPDQLTVQFAGDPRTPGGEVRATVTVKVPATSIPLINANMGQFSFTESHTEAVDLYRSVVK